MRQPNRRNPVLRLDHSNRALLGHFFASAEALHHQSAGSNDSLIMSRRYRRANFLQSAFLIFAVMPQKECTQRARAGLLRCFEGRPARTKLTSQGRTQLVEPIQNLRVIEFQLRREAVGETCLVVYQPAANFYEKLQFPVSVPCPAEGDAAGTMMEQQFQQ